ncbi:conserved hypothetical protein [Neospora caninum Liverpool]|uniref:Uncharacterized protein n=1 Tax=Neospora caninum (strain Liverpool) TaxID=572307 RepID=F0V719_NEOCL|nr:conserved hypothetical protein [Neospora caninum Liverpool]CBZ49510.1 conserved hypothetical protein [Neospora caninum Liverpool]CEL64089.1 TPA: hypothetical protein BN1204_000080 [Neospora caninum Liverpool]|eukprot:XP_003879545.1 conserved hypothetical protein [Neospora caninum Liverpool]
MIAEAIWEDANPAFSSRPSLSFVGLGGEETTVVPLGSAAEREKNQDILVCSGGAKKFERETVAHEEHVSSSRARREKEAGVNAEGEMGSIKKTEAMPGPQRSACRCECQGPEDPREEELQANNEPPREREISRSPLYWQLPRTLQEGHRTSAKYETKCKYALEALSSLSATSLSSCSFGFDETLVNRDSEIPLADLLPSSSQPIAGFLTSAEGSLHIPETHDKASVTACFSVAFPPAFSSSSASGDVCSSSYSPPLLASPTSTSASSSCPSSPSAKDEGEEHTDGDRQGETEDRARRSEEKPVRHRRRGVEPPPTRRQQESACLLFVDAPSPSRASLQYHAQHVAALSLPHKARPPCRAHRRSLSASACVAPSVRPSPSSPSCRTGEGRRTEKAQGPPSSGRSRGARDRASLGSSSPPSSQAAAASLSSPVQAPEASGARDRMQLPSPPRHHPEHGHAYSNEDLSICRRPCPFQSDKAFPEIGKAWSSCASQIRSTPKKTPAASNSLASAPLSASLSSSSGEAWLATSDARGASTLPSPSFPQTASVSPAASSVSSSRGSAYALPQKTSSASTSASPHASASHSFSSLASLPLVLSPPSLSPFVSLRTTDAPSLPRGEADEARPGRETPSPPLPVSPRFEGNPTARKTGESLCGVASASPARPRPAASLSPSSPSSPSHSLGLASSCHSTGPCSPHRGVEKPEPWRGQRMEHRTAGAEQLRCQDGRDESQRERDSHASSASHPMRFSLSPPAAPPHSPVPSSSLPPAVSSLASHLTPFPSVSPISLSSPAMENLRVLKPELGHRHMESQGTSLFALLCAENLPTLLGATPPAASCLSTASASVAASGVHSHARLLSPALHSLLRDATDWQRQSGSPFPSSHADASRVLLATHSGHGRGPESLPCFASPCLGPVGSQTSSTSPFPAAALGPLASLASPSQAVPDALRVLLSRLVQPVASGRSDKASSTPTASTEAKTGEEGLLRESRRFAETDAHVGLGGLFPERRDAWTRDSHRPLECTRPAPTASSSENISRECLPGEKMMESERNNQKTKPDVLASQIHAVGADSKSAEQQTEAQRAGDNAAASESSATPHSSFSPLVPRGISLSSFSALSPPVVPLQPSGEGGTGRSRQDPPERDQWGEGARKRKRELENEDRRKRDLGSQPSCAPLESQEGGVSALPCVETSGKSKVVFQDAHGRSIDPGEGGEEKANASTRSLPGSAVKPGGETCRGERRERRSDRRAEEEGHDEWGEDFERANRRWEGRGICDRLQATREDVRECREPERGGREKTGEESDAKREGGTQREGEVGDRYGNQGERENAGEHGRLRTRKKGNTSQYFAGDNGEEGKSKLAGCREKEKPMGSQAGRDRRPEEIRGDVPEKILQNYQPLLLFLLQQAQREVLSQQEKNRAQFFPDFLSRQQSEDDRTRRPDDQGCCLSIPSLSPPPSSPPLSLMSSPPSSSLPSPLPSPPSSFPSSLPSSLSALGVSWTSSSLTSSLASSVSSLNSTLVSPLFPALSSSSLLPVLSSSLLSSSLFPSLAAAPVSAALQGRREELQGSAKPLSRFHLSERSPSISASSVAQPSFLPAFLSPLTSSASPPATLPSLLTPPLVSQYPTSSAILSSPSLKFTPFSSSPYRPASPPFRASRPFAAAPAASAAAPASNPLVVPPASPSLASSFPASPPSASLPPGLHHPRTCAVPSFASPAFSLLPFPSPLPAESYSHLLGTGLSHSRTHARAPTRGRRRKEIQKHHAFDMRQDDSSGSLDHDPSRLSSCLSSSVLSPTYPDHNLSSGSLPFPVRASVSSLGAAPAAWSPTPYSSASSAFGRSSSSSSLSTPGSHASSSASPSRLACFSPSTASCFRPLCSPAGAPSSFIEPNSSASTSSSPGSSTAPSSSPSPGSSTAPSSSPASSASSASSPPGSSLPCPLSSPASFSSSSELLSSFSVPSLSRSSSLSSLASSFSSRQSGLQAGRRPASVGPEVVPQSALKKRKRKREKPHPTAAETPASDSAVLRLSTSTETAEGDKLQNGGATSDETPRELSQFHEPPLSRHVPLTFVPSKRKPHGSSAVPEKRQRTALDASPRRFSVLASPSAPTWSSSASFSCNAENSANNKTARWLRPVAGGSGPLVGFPPAPPLFSASARSCVFSPQKSSTSLLPSASLSCASSCLSPQPAPPSSQSCASKFVPLPPSDLSGSSLPAPASPCASSSCLRLHSQACHVLPDASSCPGSEISTRLPVSDAPPVSSSQPCSPFQCASSSVASPLSSRAPCAVRLHTGASPKDSVPRQNDSSSKTASCARILCERSASSPDFRLPSSDSSTSSARAKERTLLLPPASLSPAGSVPCPPVLARATRVGHPLSSPREASPSSRAPPCSSVSPSQLATAKDENEEMGKSSRIRQQEVVRQRATEGWKTEREEGQEDAEGGREQNRQPTETRHPEERLPEMCQWKGDGRDRETGRGVYEESKVRKVGSLKAPVPEMWSHAGRVYVHERSAEQPAEKEGEGAAPQDTETTKRNASEEGEAAKDAEGEAGERQDERAARSAMHPLGVEREDRRDGRGAACVKLRDPKPEQVEPEEGWEDRRSQRRRSEEDCAQQRCLHEAAKPGSSESAGNSVSAARRQDEARGSSPRGPGGKTEIKKGKHITKAEMRLKAPGDSGEEDDARQAVAPGRRGVSRDNEGRERRDENVPGTPRASRRRRRGDVDLKEASRRPAAGRGNAEVHSLETGRSHGSRERAVDAFEDARTPKKETKSETPHRVSPLQSTPYLAREAAGDVAFERDVWNGVEERRVELYMEDFRNRKKEGSEDLKANRSIHGSLPTPEGRQKRDESPITNSKKRILAKASPAHRPNHTEARCPAGGVDGEEKDPDAGEEENLHDAACAKEARGNAARERRFERRTEATLALHRMGSVSPSSESSRSGETRPRGDTTERPEGEDREEPRPSLRDGRSEELEAEAAWQEQKDKETVSRDSDGPRPRATGIAVDQEQNAIPPCSRKRRAGREERRRVGEDANSSRPSSKRRDSREPRGKEKSEETREACEERRGGKSDRAVHRRFGERGS